MLMSLANSLKHCCAVRHVEFQRQHSFAIDLEKSFQAFGLGALAATLSPRLKTASVQTRPKPLDAPVINQTFC